MTNKAMQEAISFMREDNAPKWEAEAYTFDDNDISAMLPISQQELIAIHYLKVKRAETWNAGFSQMNSFDGRHRSGKSLYATVFGYLWEDDFWKDYEERLPQDPQSFSELVLKMDDLNKRGFVVQIDEAGGQTSASDFYEKWAKSLSKMMMAFGYLLPVCNFCAPVKDFVNSTMRKMFLSYYKVSRYDRQCSYITPYDVSFNTISRKWWYKHPRLKIFDQNLTLHRIKMPPPPRFIIDRYEKVAGVRKKNLMSEYNREIQESSVKEAKKEVNLDELIDHVYNNFYLFKMRNSKPEKPIINDVKLEFAYKLNVRMAKYVKTEVENKLMEAHRKKEAEAEERLLKSKQMTPL